MQAAGYSPDQFPGFSQFAFWEHNLRTDHPGYVYVMQQPHEPVFKVGYSKDPIQRLGTLRRKYSHLTLRYVMPGDQMLEKILHRRGCDCRDAWHRGTEWFSTKWEEGEQFLVFLGGLAESMVDSYGGDGKVPPLPEFDLSKTPEEHHERRLEIEQAMMAGYTSGLGMTGYELDEELYRMRQSGNYYCFFEAADPVPRGPKAKSFAKLGHTHRYGDSTNWHGRPVV